MITATCDSTLASHLDAYRTTVDAALNEWLPSEPECPAHLAAALRYAVFPAGKRMRPLLTLLACEACGGERAAALPAACAVELVHCYSLVHDDLPAMDDDDLRRGRPTLHKAFDEATAILAGDALLTLAFEVLARQEPARAASSVRELAAAAGACGMVGGQADDLAGANGVSDPHALLHRLESIHARKTGALLLASVRLGAIAACAGTATRHALDGYGRCVGLAFQIADDLLDVQGDETKTGKRVGKDLERGKLTFPGLMECDQARLRAEQLVDQACAAIEPLGADADRLRELARRIVHREQ